MKYTSKGHKSVEADSFGQAGEQFAERKARKLHGKSGRVGAFRVDCWSEDGSMAECEAFIGYKASGCIAGHNERFIVYRADK